MPPSPYKRNRRMKSRLMAGSEDDRVNLRTKAVEMMTGGRKAPDRGPVAHAYVPGRDRGGNIILKRPDHPAPQTTLQRPDHPAPRTTTGPKVNTPLVGSRRPRPLAVPRSRSGDVVHGTKAPEGASGPVNTAYRPAVPHRLKPESGGTGNHAAPQTAVKNDTLDKGARRPVAKRPASAYDNRLSSLARQRALSGNRNNRGTRALMSVATRDTDTGGAAWRASRGYRMGRSIQRRRARRWLRNTAQGPSRPQYT